jgi:hypothetical protein
LLSLRTREAPERPPERPGAERDSDLSQFGRSLDGRTQDGNPAGRHGPLAAGSRRHTLRLRGLRKPGRPGTATGRLRLGGGPGRLGGGAALRCRPRLGFSRCRLGLTAPRRLRPRHLRTRTLRPRRLRARRRVRVLRGGRERLHRLGLDRRRGACRALGAPAVGAAAGEGAEELGGRVRGHGEFVKPEVASKLETDLVVLGNSLEKTAEKRLRNLPPPRGDVHYTKYSTILLG